MRDVRNTRFMHRRCVRECRHACAFLHACVASVHNFHDWKLISTKVHIVSVCVGWSHAANVQRNDFITTNMSCLAVWQHMHDDSDAGGGGGVFMCKRVWILYCMVDFPRCLNSKHRTCVDLIDPDA